MAATEGRRRHCRERSASMAPIEGVRQLVEERVHRAVQIPLVVLVMMGRTGRVSVRMYVGRTGGRTGAGGDVVDASPGTPRIDVVASSNAWQEPTDEKTHPPDRARRARVARRHRHERLQRRLILFGTHPDRLGALRIGHGTPDLALRELHLSALNRGISNFATLSRSRGANYYTRGISPSASPVRSPNTTDTQPPSLNALSSSASSRSLTSIPRVRDTLEHRLSVPCVTSIGDDGVPSPRTLFSTTVPTPRQQSLTPSSPRIAEWTVVSVRVRS